MRRVSTILPRRLTGGYSERGESVITTKFSGLKAYASGDVDDGATDEEVLDELVLVSWPGSELTVCIPS